MTLTQPELDAVAVAVTPAVTAAILAAMNELEVTPVSAAVNLLMTAASKGGIRSSIGLATAKDAGAVADGVANDGPALLLAEIAAIAEGGPIRLTTGTYLVSNSITLTRQVVFEQGAKLKPASGQTITLSGGFLANDSQYVFDTTAGGQFVVQNKNYTPEQFGAVGDKVTNDDWAFKAMIDSIIGTGRIELNYAKSYRVNSTITIDGLQKSLTITGTSGGRSIVAGGVDIDSSPTITWGGIAGVDANNPEIIFKLIDGHGTLIRGIAFQTLSSNPGVISIDNVTAFRFINTVSTRFAKIERCEFRRCAVGIDFHDLGEIPANDNNMDGNTISECQFYSYRTAVKVQQANAYDTNIYHCAFYGDPTYTQHHLWIAKGYVYSDQCYWGKMATGGVGILVQNGCIVMGEVYSETDNGPFLEWESYGAATNVLSITGGIGIMQNTGTLPGGISITNKTAGMLSISDIHVSGKLRQEHPDGCISVSGNYQPTFDSSTNLLHRCFYGSNFLGTAEGLIGSAAGNATVSGATPAYTKTLATGARVIDIASFNGASEIVLDHVYAPGYRAGMKYNVNAGKIDLRWGGWQFVKTLPNYADNAAAIAGGLTQGMEYQTGGIQKIVQ